MSERERLSGEDEGNEKVIYQLLSDTLGRTLTNELVYLYTSVRARACACVLQSCLPQVKQKY